MGSRRKEPMIRLRLGGGRSAARAACESLEARLLMSGGAAGSVALPTPVPAGDATPFFRAAHRGSGAAPASSSSPPAGATTPAQMRHFYGIDRINFAGVVGDGRGQTIA